MRERDCEREVGMQREDLGEGMRLRDGTEEGENEEERIVR